MARARAWVGSRSRGAKVWTVVGLAVLGLALALSFRGGGAQPVASAEDPRWVELVEAATFGASHVIYANSPGGVVASAQRTARFRPQIEGATAGTGVDPDLVEALILLESAGRPEVVVGNDPANAAGLTQILASTATEFLGMRVDLTESRRIFKQIETAKGARNTFREESLRVERRLIDDRFDPQKAIAGTVRYLVQARETLGREDLAMVSYHMGIGNLSSVVRAYASAPAADVADLVRERALSFAQLYFDSSPRRNAPAWRALDRLSDDSANYIWKLYAAREIMRLLRDDPDELGRLARRHGAKASAEEVLHDVRESAVFERRADVLEATADGRLTALPREPETTHFSVHKRLGELAPQFDARRRDYAALAPDALFVLEYIAAEVFRIAGDETPLRVTSAIRDVEYQRLLATKNEQATDGFSLHTSGFAFDILRKYGSDEQAAAFQFVLDRLEILGLVAWIREPNAIHVVVVEGVRDRFEQYSLAL